MIDPRRIATLLLLVLLAGLLGPQIATANDAVPDVPVAADPVAIDPEIERLLDKARQHREDRAFNRAYRVLGKAYKRGGNECLPCVLAFVDTDLTAGDLDGALDSAGVVWPDDDRTTLLRRLAARTQGASWQVMTRLVWRLADAGDIDQLIEVVEGYLDSHDHRVRSSVCAAAFIDDSRVTAQINDELVAMDWRGPFLGAGDVTPPRGLSNAIPAPTARSLVHKTAGNVHLFAVVSARGKATTVRTIRGLADGLTAQAEAAVWDWQFTAGERAGAPVDTCLTIALRFPPR